MDARVPIARPLAWSLVLHAGLLGALVLMALPCARFEAFFDDTGLPTWLNPVQCRQPLLAPGPVIEATLVGLPAVAKAATEPRRSPPPRDKPEPARSREKAKVKTLAPPPDKPALKDQDKVVAVAANPADKAAREQQRRERQRPAELEVDKLLAKLDQLKQQSAEATRKAEQIEARSDAKPAAAPENLPEAPEARTGAGGHKASLLSAYAATLTQTITQNWLRPQNIPAGSVCPIHIEQIPGGQVINVHVLPACPFDGPGRQSVKNAVLRAQPLPYAGYERVFQRDITLNFKVLE